MRKKTETKIQKLGQKVAITVIVVGMLLPLVAHADSTESILVSDLECVVTAYYQPVAGQQNYAKGNFEAEVAMNGDDTTANGSKVKLGTVAAPPQYPFGTIVDIGGFGVGEVTDRGGAIKGNRFDIWVGKGDEGVARATNWGKRTTKCTVYLPGSTVPSEVKNRMGTYNLPSAALPSAYWESKQSMGHKNLGLGDNDEDVTVLTKTLKQLGYAVTVGSNFDTTVEKAVITFQINKNIVASKDAYGAGVVGPRTWQALLASEGASLDASDIAVPYSKSTTGQSTPDESAGTGSGNVLSFNLEFGAEGEEISKLQENLRLLGYFDGPTITGYFGPATKAALIRFQLAEKLITTADVDGAGAFDDATRTRMMAVLLGKTEPVPAPVAMLKKGSKGAEVSTLQEKLAKLKIYQGPITDYYGDQTAQAVTDFQSQYNIHLDSEEDQGVFNTKTATRLDQALGLDISLSPAFTRYIEQFSLVNGVLKHGL